MAKGLGDPLEVVDINEKKCKALAGLVPAHCQILDILVHLVSVLEACGGVEVCVIVDNSVLVLQCLRQIINRLCNKTYLVFRLGIYPEIVVSCGDLGNGAGYLGDILCLVADNVQRCNKLYHEKAGKNDYLLEIHLAEIAVSHMTVKNDDRAPAHEDSPAENVACGVAASEAHERAAFVIGYKALEIKAPVGENGKEAVDILGHTNDIVIAVQHDSICAVEEKAVFERCCKVGGSYLRSHAACKLAVEIYGLYNKYLGILGKEAAVFIGNGV